MVESMEWPSASEGTEEWLIVYSSFVYYDLHALEHSVIMNFRLRLFITKIRHSDDACYNSKQKCKYFMIHCCVIQFMVIIQNMQIRLFWELGFWWVVISMIYVAVILWSIQFSWSVFDDSIYLNVFHWWNVIGSIFIPFPLFVVISINLFTILRFVLIDYN